MAYAIGIKNNDGSQGNKPGGFRRMSLRLNRHNHVTRRHHVRFLQATNAHIDHANPHITEWYFWAGDENTARLFETEADAVNMMALIRARGILQEHAHLVLVTVIPEPLRDMPKKGTKILMFGGSKHPIPRAVAWFEFKGEPGHWYCVGRDGGMSPMYENELAQARYGPKCPR